MKLDKKRILKNSTALYLRMAVLTVITLYTSRIVLEELGVESFGIYNIVGGVVVVFSFLNSALISSTQRFINFEAEKGDGNIGHIFSMCVNIHIVLAVVILLLSETIGLFILNNYINIPPEKIDAANWVFQFSLGLFIINILRAPYEAVIVANEEMSFFAYLSIFEGLLRLGIAFALAIFGGNKLVFYAIMLFVAAVLVFFCYYLYVRLSFPCAKYKFCADRQLFKRIMGFSIWSLMGEASNMLNSQGIAFVVNILCGVTVNAAMGLAEQINGAVARFVSNFQIAFSPQIVKLYAARNYGDLHSIIYLATKISFYLSLVIGLPLVVNVKYVLGIWLKSYPEYTEGLVVAILCYLFVTVLNAPLWTAIKATGNIRTYQIIISLINISNVPLVAVVIYLGYSPVAAIAARVVINLVATFWRCAYVGKKINLDVSDYIKNVIFKSLSVGLVAAVIPIYIVYEYGATLTGFVFSSTISEFLIVLLVWTCGLTVAERESLKNIISAKMRTMIYKKNLQ